MIHTQPLTTAEEQLMLSCWKLGNFYFRELFEALPEPKPHQNTVSTYLKILVEKGFIASTREGRIFRYAVITGIEDYKKILLENLIATFYENSGRDVLKFLFEEKLISQQDLMSYFNLKIEMVGNPQSSPKFEVANEILNPKKNRKKDKKKKHK